jgi:hypothetical protein
MTVVDQSISDDELTELVRRTEEASTVRGAPGRTQVGFS